MYIIQVYIDIIILLMAQRNAAPTYLIPAMQDSEPRPSSSDAVHPPPARDLPQRSSI